MLSGSRATNRFDPVTLTACGLNAPCTIVLQRRQHDTTTKDYIERRIAEGKSRREATRLLKRYLARRIYPLLQHQPS